ncbi:MAG TPA: small multi-drug export protein [Methanocellales archaeon]|nr:small multi-drug export protein [Methanocellales archaeon]
MPFPDWLPVIVVAAMPISELRGAIPVAILHGFDPLTAYMLAVIGNLIPVVPLLLWLEPVSNYLRRYKNWDRFFNWLFTRTRSRHSEYFEKYGAIALSLFVAIPLPVTGAWTGCAAAFVFGIKFSHALPAIFFGVLIAGVIVTLTTLGILVF